MKAAAALASLAVVAAPAAARAGGPDLESYYGGERTSAVVVGSLGAAAAGAGAFLVTRPDELSRGLGVAWLSLGGLEALGGLVYGLQVGGEIDHYTALRAADPARYRSEEADHLRGTSERFVYYRLTELALSLGGGGAIAYGLAAGRPAWTGAGLGVATLAVPLAVLDTVNDARARSYRDALGGVSVAATPGGLALTLGGRF